MNQYQYRVENRVADLYVYRAERRLPENTHVVSAGRILALRSYRSIIFFDHMKTVNLFNVLFVMLLHQKLLLIFKKIFLVVI